MLSSGGIYSLLQALNYCEGAIIISFPQVFFFNTDAEKYLLIDLTWNQTQNFREF